MNVGIVWPRSSWEYMFRIFGIVSLQRRAATDIKKNDQQHTVEMVQ
jgi:hypothetical protein